MKKRYQAVFSIMTCIVLLSASTASNQLKGQSFNVNLANKLQNTLDSLVTLFTNTKGMAASVYYPGQGIWKGASGLSYAGQPVHINMEFGLASNTKLFTAVAMLLLAENNIIHLSDSLWRWLPPYANINPNITIKQLLNHTSGVSDPFFTTALLDSIQAHPTHVYIPQEVLGWVEPPVNAPGAGYYYSNINYILAGMVAQSATGNHISHTIRDSILTPLQLDSTFYDIEESVVGVLSHRWYNGADLNDTPRISLNTAGGPSGSIFSTPGEMAQWYTALMGGQVLTPASFAEMTNFGATSNYGLGIQRSTYFGKLCWGHGGVTLGYKSRIIFDTCMKATVVGLSNSNPSAVDGITALLYKVLLDNLPGCGNIISGPVVVTQGQNGVIYTVTPITNATSYMWILPNGATGTSSTNSISVNFGAGATSGYIRVKGINSYGEGIPSSLYIMVTAAPLALEAIDLQATTQENSVLLEWTCPSGPPVQDFRVQRSGDGIAFDDIGVAEGNCPAGIPTILNFHDIHPLRNGPLFYRIAKVSASGSTVYSNIATATFEAQRALVFPNPSANELHIVCNVAQQAMLTDLYGNLMRKIRAIVGETVESVSDLPGGIYCLAFDSGQVEKVVIVR